MLVVAALLALGSGATVAVAEGPASDGILVLRNGNVLSGSVRRIGDNYRIESSGGVLQVPAGQVERFAPSLTAAYEARRRDRVGSSADAHVDLARWCLQLGLHEFAARELLDARTLEPGHRGARLLELQLRQAIDASTGGDPQPVGRPIPTSIADAESAMVDSPVNAVVTPEISAEARVDFVRRIQPMLVQSCATGGCHQAGSTQRLQLDRWALMGKGNADIVRRNLAAVLRELDVDDPMTSPLLLMARTPHGHGAMGASRPLTARQSELLIDWLKAASGVDATNTQVAADENSAASYHDDGVELATYEEPFDQTPAAQDQSRSPAATRFQPRDAFDPEVFNRRFAEVAAEFEPATEHKDATEPQPEASEPPPPREP